MTGFPSQDLNSNANNLSKIIEGSSSISKQSVRSNCFLNPKSFMIDHKNHDIMMSA